MTSVFVGAEEDRQGQGPTTELLAAIAMDWECDWAGSLWIVLE